MKLRPLTRVAMPLALLCIGLFYAGGVSAQVIDFGRLDAFETMGTGTQRGGAPVKALIDDSEQHTIFFTILESNTEAKIYWKSPNGEQTTIIHGSGVKAFQTAGQFKIEALGDEHHSFKYGYVIFRLKNKEDKT